MRKYTKILKTMLAATVLAVSVGLLKHSLIPDKVNAAGTEATLSQTFKSVDDFQSTAVSFQKGTQADYNANKASAKEIQDAASSEKIYMWHDANGTYSWYSPADTVYLPADSSNLLSDCTSLTNVDVSQWNTSRVTDMGYMFSGDLHLKNIDVSGWDTSKVTNMSSMFKTCSDMTSIDVSKWNTANVTNMVNMFYSCTRLTDVDVSKWNTSHVTGMSYMFYGCKGLKTVDVSKWDTLNVTGIDGIFNECRALTKIDVSGWDTSNVTNMAKTFNNCTQLTDVNVSKWNTSKVVDMSFMFGDDKNLKNVDVSNWNTGNVQNMQSTFMGCSTLTSLDVHKWNTSSVTSTRAMFGWCTNLANVDVSGWDMSKNQHMTNMFVSCQSLTKVDVSHWTTGQVYDADSMFNGCTNLATVDVSGWDTSTLRSASSMFKDCSSLTSTDVSKWTVPKINNTEKMFSGCTKLTTLDFGKWEPSASIDAYNMMSGDTGLTRLVFSPAFKVTTRSTNASGATTGGIGSEDALTDWYKCADASGNAVVDPVKRSLTPFVESNDAIVAGTWIKTPPEPFKYKLVVQDSDGNPIANYAMSEKDIFVYGQDADKTGYYTKTLSGSKQVSNGSAQVLTYPDTKDDWIHAAGDQGVVLDTSIKDQKSIYTITIVPADKSFKTKVVTVRTALTDGISLDTSKCEIDGAVFDENRGTLKVTLDRNSVDYGMVILKNITGNSMPDKYSFQMAITPDNANCPMPSNKYNWYDSTTHTVTLDSSEGGRARELKFTADNPGTYGYTIKEVNRGQYGWDCDTSTYHITYTIDSNGNVSIAQTIDGAAISDEEKAADIKTYKSYTGNEPSAKTALVASTSRHYIVVTPTGVNDTDFKPLIAACVSVMATIIVVKMIKH